jgi:serine/threonine protein kinase
MSKFHDLDVDLDDAGCDGDDPLLDINRCCDDSAVTGVGRKDFLFGRTLGEGSYARVMHAKRKVDLSTSYAVKIMEKSFIRKEKKV